MWYVYILEAGNGMLYTGITNDVERRMQMHEKGKGARFTRIFGFKELLYQEEQPTKIDAIKRELEIKRWPRARKLKLIAGEELS